ncbi:MAG: efflux RND transporter permease subunit, partial [Sterolibacterium sp.]|nr:efflux RND transporter permease subunit [Sterolibacterium sp.]
MLDRLIAFSLTQRLLMLVLTLGLIIAGALAFSQLPIDAFPDVSTTQVKIIIKSPGMTPEEIETRITTPIEQELLGIPHQRMLRSTSKYALADITLDFDDSTDIYWARQQVSERLSSVMKDLPANASGGLAPITTPLSEMFMFTIDGPPTMSLEEKRTLLDWTLRPALRTIPGVADVNSLGGRVRTFEVSPQPERLAARGVTLKQLQEALEANNHNDGAGSLADGEEALLVRAEGAITRLADVAAIVVKQDAGTGQVVRVEDIAEVRHGSLTRYGAVTHGGREEAVEGLVLGLRGANAQAVVAGVKARLAELAPSLPKGVTITPFYDRSSLIERAVGTVSRALLEAIVLVVLLLLAFLGNLRASLVVALMLPLAALATFILMRLFGLSANLMSLGGLAIAIGMLVDAAVVVVENVETRLARGGSSEHLPLLHLVYRATREVAQPVASGIAIIIIVFLPLLTLQGLEGKLFAPVALTIVFALSASLLLSLTVVPVLAAWLLKRGEAHEPWLMKKLNAGYSRLLGWALSHEKMVAALAVASLLAAIGAYLVVGKSFMPTMDEGDLIVQIEKLPSIGLEQTVAMDLRIQEAILKDVPEVADIVARVGSDELGLDPMGLNQTDSFLVLKPRKEWRKPDKEWLTDQLRATLSGFPGIAFSFSQPIDMRISEMLTGARGDLAVKIYGPDLNTLNGLAQNIEALLKKVPGAEDTLTVKNDGVQYFRINIDRLAAGRHGLNIEEVQADLRRLLEGQNIGTVMEQGRRVPLVIRGPEALRHSPADFADLRITTATGDTLPLASIASLERVDGPVKVDREAAQRYVVVQSNVRGRDLVGFVDEARQRVAQEIELPAGYHLGWGGEFENQQRAAARLQVVIPIALALIFFLLFSTFRSLQQTLLVLSNIPFALVGGIFALAMSGEYLSVPASVGFIALLGIAVLNGVVIVSTFNQLRDQGMPIQQVVVEGAKRRLRPVLMTANIAAFGLVPLLFASGPGSEIQKPLAIVVIGGLASATLLTLLILPLLYRRFGASPTPGSPG